MTVGGYANVRFIENCVVRADGPIVVRTAIMNSIVTTKDTVQTGSGGIIIGSEICHAPFIVEREYTGVRFSLDKAAGKVLVERL